MKLIPLILIALPLMAQQAVTPKALTFSASAPSYSFTNATNAGMFFTAGPFLNFALNGGTAAQLQATKSIFPAVVLDVANQDAGFVRLAASVLKVTDGSTGFGRIALDNSTPANAAVACTAQSIWADANYVYVCTASGAVKRAPIATW